MAEQPGAGRRLAVSRPIETLRFVVVGAYVADCLVKTPRLPAWGREYEAHSVRMSPGGKAFNQAVGLARLGAEVAAVGVVGADGVGRDVLAALKRERVDISWMRSQEGVATSVCLCLVSDEGESAILWHIDDQAAVLPETVSAATPAMEQADAVLVNFEVPVRTVRSGIETAGSCDARVFVAPAPVLGNPAEAASLPWEQVDVLIPNEVEARALLDDSDDVRADELANALSHKLGVSTVAVTLGASGCVLHASGFSCHYPAHQAVAVDTTGAGDAFTATFAAYLTSGASEPDAVDAAQAVAARTVQHAGGHESALAPASSP